LRIVVRFVLQAKALQPFQPPQVALLQAEVLRSDLRLRSCRS
jgi:hypothetical protein